MGGDDDPDHLDHDPGDQPHAHHEVSGPRHREVPALGHHHERRTQPDEHEESQARQPPRGEARPLEEAAGHRGHRSGHEVGAPGESRERDHGFERLEESRHRAR